MGVGDSSPLSKNQDHRRIQRSVPVQLPRNPAKIKINENIYHPEEFKVRKVIPNKISPPRFSDKPPKRSRVVKVDQSNSNSRKRIIDMRGPYAQNLTKPKLTEARGLQRIALKNQLQQQWSRAPHGYNSEAMARQDQWNSLNSGNQNSSSGGVGYSDARDEKRSNRVGSLGALGAGQNYVIQHAMMPQSGKQIQPTPHSLDNQHFNAQRKRVWVPTNKKHQLKQMQAGMNKQNSVFSGGYGSSVRRSP